MKQKFTLGIVCLLMIKYTYAQHVSLLTNGYVVNLKKIDTLFFNEFDTKTVNSKAGLQKEFGDKQVVEMDTRLCSISNKTESINKPVFHSNFYATDGGDLEAPTATIFLKPTNETVIKEVGKYGILIPHPVFKGYFYLTLQTNIYNTGDKILEACNFIFNNHLASIAEPVFIRLLKPNNPLLPLEWNVNNTGQVPGATAGADMKVLPAWCMSTGAGIKVAIVDEGVQLNHPDLQANLLPGYDATGNNSGGNPNTNDAHGTNCAGIVAAVDNTIGAKGVAFNSKIIPIRCAYEAIINGQLRWVSSDTWLSNSINEAVTRGADVISNSWGFSDPNNNAGSAQIDAAITNAVNNGRSGKGAVVLFSAGNDNHSAVYYPASNTNVIAVGASTQCDTRKRSSSNPILVNQGAETDPLGTSCDGEDSWGSNYGTGLDVMAPGVWISTTDLTGTNGYDLGDYYQRFNGTSAACPNAAAVVALILAANPNFTGIQARNILEQTCDKVGGYVYQGNVSGQPNGTWSNQAGYGRINADRAVRMALGMAETTISGNSVICSPATTANYTLNNLPTCGANIVTWSSNIPQVSFSPQTGVTTTLNTNGYFGLINITATNNGEPYSFQVQTGGTATIAGTYTNAYDGTVNPLGFYPDVTNPACTGYYITTNIDVPTGSTAYWQKISSTGVVKLDANC